MKPNAIVFLEPRPRPLDALPFQLILACGYAIRHGTKAAAAAVKDDAVEQRYIAQECATHLRRIHTEVAQ